MRMFRNLWTWIALTTCALLGGGGTLLEAQSSGGYPTSPTFQRVRIGPAQTTPAVGGLNMSGALTAASEAISGASTAASYAATGNLSGAQVSVSGSDISALVNTQSISDIQNVTAGASLFDIGNHNAGTGAYGLGYLENGTQFLDFYLASANYSSSIVTGAPTGPVAGIGTAGSSVMCFSTNGAARECFDGSGNVTTPGAGTTPWPHTAALITETSSSCVVTQNVGNVASCSRSATGLIVVTFTSTIGHNAVCSATVNNTTVSITLAPYFEAYSAAGTSMDVQANDTSGAYDGWAVNLVCI
jgi:hypothetical protein